MKNRVFFAKPKLHRNQFVFSHENGKLKKYKIVEHDTYNSNNPNKFGNFNYYWTTPSLGCGGEIGVSIFVSKQDAIKDISVIRANNLRRTGKFDITNENWFNWIKIT